MMDGRDLQHTIVLWPERTRLKAAGEVEKVALAQIDGAATLNEWQTRWRAAVRVCVLKGVWRRETSERVMWSFLSECMFVSDRSYLIRSDKPCKVAFKMSVCVCMCVSWIKLACLFLVHALVWSDWSYPLLRSGVSFLHELHNHNSSPLLLSIILTGKFYGSCSELHFELCDIL